MANRKPSFSEYIPSSGSFLRTPLLPFAELLAWSEGLAAAAASDDELAAAVSDDARILCERLRGLVARPEVAEAIVVASRTLGEDLASWLKEPSGARRVSVERSLTRYFSRMCSRCTPFGLFAGVTTLTRGSAFQVALAPRSAYRRKTRLDGGLAMHVHGAVLARPELRRALAYRTNTSLYRAAGRLRYAKADVGEQLSYQLVEVVTDDYLDAVLARAEQPTPALQLVDLLVTIDPEIERDEAIEFIDTLIERQLLEPMCAPHVTGEESLAALRESLSRSEGASFARALDETLGAVAALDARGLCGASVADYDALCRPLAELCGLGAQKSHVQVELFKPSSEATLGDEVSAALLEGVQYLRRLCPPSDFHADFIRRFTARYELRRVPLLDVLDEDIGIGFEARVDRGHTPLLAGLVFHDGGGGGGADTPPRRAHTWLARRLFELPRGARELVLDESDMEHMAMPTLARVADAFQVSFTLAARSWEALRSGDFCLHFSGLDGPSGVNLAGRFCHLDDDFCAQVQEHLAVEAALQPDAVFAEIVHLPQGRTNNVIQRPVLRPYEIPILGAGSADAEHRIPLQDLTIGIENGAIVLRSVKLGKRVVPRLTSAHNTTSGFLHYRFLASLRYAERDSLHWSWGPLESLPYLPRVRIGKIVFALARWQLEKADITKIEQALKGLKRAATNADTERVQTEVFRSVRALRRLHGWPRFIAVADGDNKLVVDLDNLLSVDSFAQLVKGRSMARIEEVWPEPEQLLVQGPEGAFCHECVASFVRASPKERPAARVRTPSPLARGFSPGTEWLYVKLYTGLALADRTLVELAPLVRGWLEQDPRRRWHFLRYNDPEFHVRLRFKGDRETLLELLAAIERAVQPLIRAQLIWRMQVDTFEPELERYGGPAGIALAEEIFHHDSDAVLAILEELEGNDLGAERWKLGTLGVLELYRALGFDEDAVRARVQATRESFAREFNAGSDVFQELGSKYRAERATLEAILAREGEGQPQPLQRGIAAIQRRSVALSPVREELAKGSLDVPVSDLAWAYAHMFANRLFSHSAREHELAIHELLRRYLAADRARGTQRRPRACAE
ncbi:MAG: lantibiotic dehydratase [Deltaproteobacteria bacterium]